MPQRCHRPWTSVSQPKSCLPSLTPTESSSLRWKRSATAEGPDLGEVGGIPLEWPCFYIGKWRIIKKTELPYPPTKLHEADFSRMWVCVCCLRHSSPWITVRFPTLPVDLTYFPAKHSDGIPSWKSFPSSILRWDFAMVRHWNNSQMSHPWWNWRMTWQKRGSLERMPMTSSDLMFGHVHTHTYIHTYI